MTENLANFTDVLGDDELGDSQQSQPLSLTSSAESHTQMNDKPNKRTRPVKGTGQYNEFRSIEEIDTKYRDVFAYPFFNLVQSRVIEDALYSDKSLVVCAPTGSGKTVVFEMAIVQLLIEMEEKNSTEDFKIIYMAPVKALCTERLTEWYSKFTRLGLLCIEVTGDTDVDFTQLQAYKIIITTPEKWDMLTRRWRDHRGLVEMIKLFLIDEVHILNDESRGPVLEAVVSRMKTIQSAAQLAHRIEKLQKQYQNSSVDECAMPSRAYDSGPTIRFVAVSATVSNPDDVAAWLKTDDKPAVYHKFGDECRPVKLRRVVEGYPCPDGTSIFKFDIILNYKLWPIIQKYHDGKPTLIFCNTRKSVLLTAETLSREITITFSPEQKMKLSALASTIKNKKLQSLVLAGVGCHHAGMLYEERNYIEYAFRNGDLPILITTTTLAMGVNLPAHLVIIKNTQQYVNGAYQEYSISTVLQMVGRAGRPQFDTDATAVIMTRQRDKARYQALAGGSEPLQSYLHKRLAENLNSETALGTVCDVAQCVQWLRSTFLYVRAARDPKRYLGLTSTAPDHLILKKIEELCVRAMNGLATAGLITMDEASCIESTEAGRLMSVFYLDLETMKLIMKIQGNESLERLLWLICDCHELADMHLRTDERRTLNALNRNNAAATIRYPMKGKISTRQMKLSCMIQAILGCIPIPDPSLNQEAMKVMRIADRVCKCLVAYVTRPEPVTLQLQYFSAVLNTIILAKCIAAHLWENSPYVSKQLKGIGPTFSTLLATAGKVNFMLLEESHPRDLERIMNKGPPVGNILRKQISLMPKYQLEATPIDEKTASVKLLLLNQAHLSENIDNLTAGPNHKCYVVAGDSENHILLLTSFKDKDLITVYDGTITYEIRRKHGFEHKIYFHCISSSFVGIDAQCEYTFTDLMTVNPHSVHLHFYEGNTTNLLKKQANVSDTLKERKRKNNIDEISQSKEKKKRDNALTEKFRLLKESFGRTSTVLKKDLQKTEEMTKNVLNDLGCSDQPTREAIAKEKPNVNTIIIDENADFGESTVEPNFPDNDEDIMDDAKIDSILNEIENEITKVNTEPKRLLIDFDGERSGKTNARLFNKTSNAANQNQVTSKRTYKTRNMKSNYKFLDLLEQNTNFSDEEVPVKETGFSDAIKQHVDTFIQNSYKIPEPVEFTMSNLYQKPKCTEITSPNINEANKKLNDFSVVNSDIHFEENSLPINFNTNKYNGNKEIEHRESNYAKLMCASKSRENEDTDRFMEEELPEINLIEPSTELVSTTISDMTTDTDKQDENNDRWDYRFTGNAENINNINDSLLEFQNSEQNDKNKIQLILDKKTETITNNHSQDTEIKVLNHTTKDSIFMANENTIDLFSDTTNKNLHQSQLQLVPTDKQPATVKVANQCYLYNNISLWSKQQNKIDIKQTNNSVANAAAGSRQVEAFKGTQSNSLAHLLHSNQNKQYASSDQQDRSTNSKTTKNQSTEYEHKYAFSAEKVEVQTKYTSNHKIRVIRRIKVDLDVREIVSICVKENVNELDSNFNKQEHTTNVYEHSTPSCLEAKTTYYKCNRNTDNQNNIMMEELPNFDSIDEVKKNVNETLMFENMKRKNKENLQGPTTSIKVNTKSEQTHLLEEVQSGKDSSHVGNRIPEKERNIENILQKYAQIIRRNNNNDLKNSLYPPASNDNNIKQAPFKPNRPFKITEIQNLNVPLIAFIDNVKSTAASIPQSGNVQSITANRTETSTNVTEIQNPSEKPLEYLELTPCQSPEQLLEQSLEISDDDYKIDQSMLNPKTLLQNMGKDDLDTELEIIPPPPEFCNDDVNYSVAFDDSGDLESRNYFDELNQTVQEIHNPSVFEDRFPDTSNLTPSKEIETWTLDCDDKFDKSLPYTTPPHSYTVMRRKMFQNYKSQDADGTRQGRLSQFKFNCKNKFKM